jgi:hypothetical protein
MPCPCLAFFTNSVNFTRPSSRRPKTGPLTKIAHPGSTWSFIHGTVGLTMDPPCNMAVYAPSLSIFLLSQFPTAPLSSCAYPRPPPKSWFYLLLVAPEVAPTHRKIIAFVSASISHIFTPRRHQHPPASKHTLVTDTIMPTI